MNNLFFRSGWGYFSLLIAWAVREQDISVPQFTNEADTPLVSVITDVAVVGP